MVKFSNSRESPGPLPLDPCMSLATDFINTLVNVRFSFLKNKIGERSLLTISSNQTAVTFLVFYMPYVHFMILKTI